MQLEYVVAAGQGGQKLGVFLKKQGLSTSLIRSLKHVPHGIQVDGCHAKTNHALSPGERVCLCLPQKETGVEPEDIPLDVVFESSHALVVNKPAGMVVHPTMSYKGGTMANAYAFWAVRQGLSPVFRPIGRLDRNTSGLMLLAKHAHAAHIMQRRAKKTYLALAEGDLPLGSYEINAPLAPEQDSLVRQQVCTEGKPSLTRYRVLAASSGVFLAKVTPLTGRTHQIRAHFAYAGHPLLGDDLYGGGVALLARHGLHCARLFFFDESGGEGNSAEAALPADMLQAMAQAKIDWDGDL